MEEVLDKRFSEFIAVLESISLVFSPVAKKIPPQAYPIWKLAIKGFTLSQAKKVLTDWPLQHTRMILPADLTRELNNIRSNQIEAHADEIRHQDNQPLNVQVPSGFENIIEAVKRAGINSDRHGVLLWAKRLQILEAYGFKVYLFSSHAWRKALYKDDYRFEDMPSLPYHNPNRCYIPAPSFSDPDDQLETNIHQKFLFFYEQVVGSFELVEGVEDKVFGLMDRYGTDYWLRFFEDQREAA